MILPSIYTLPPAPLPRTTDYVFLMSPNRRILLEEMSVQSTNIKEIKAAMKDQAILGCTRVSCRMDLW
jgi:hypothetical protein